MIKLLIPLLLLVTLNIQAASQIEPYDADVISNTQSERECLDYVDFLEVTGDLEAELNDQCLDQAY